MEQEVTCKSLVATYQDNKKFFCGPQVCEFEVLHDSLFKVRIEQCGIRKIAVMTEKDVSTNELLSVFSRVERLLMLFEGAFASLPQIDFMDSKTNRLDSLSKYYMTGRLSYFVSANYCSINEDKLLEFDSILTGELYAKWEKLLEELDIVHQMYLYFLSDNGVTVDVKCAFLIELAEPLVEIIKNYKNDFVELNPGSRGTTLKMCLKALIEKYGQDIFKVEFNTSYYDKFISTMVNSRVRIMHIKRKQTKKYFNAEESILYSLKISLLYRKIMFDLLDIEYEKYELKLSSIISRLNMWNGILDNLLLKLS